MTILAIDTSNDAMAIALSKDEQVIAEYISINKNKHSTRLMPAINQLMQDANIAPNHLTKIAVAKGPGSYTGVRVGLATAKTMGWSLNIPVVGVSSLQVLALQAKPVTGLICPFFDARRDMVFTGLYDSKLDLVQEERNVSMDEWLDQLSQLKEKIVFISPNMANYQERIVNKLGEYAEFMPEGFNQPRPGLLALFARDKKSNQVHQLQPNYLRLVEAEAKWLANQEEQAHE
ncbi:tRNA (adenosine(37)-N6)-threonylcarbamoyltransferase complex dimerization subunit type 1 TsaB [Amphibacillus sediminis]|uniref:tRNA (adenosine(37)-N6)-threonylcarbamoyltransferase complex dimerization subunit type 1 TsaB n=1 Tax=Amphibacillus sediminis TaxID=360185 RepID=UPI00082E1EF0|nr:tRNA (adenosine(37)-N6)-threonylcarbamoyltransferase complex dimerization subunit type 1 TsaB [Amphibacillus sediminis]